MAVTTGAAAAANRVSLGSWPTPLEPMPRLAESLGLRPEDLYIKRDDLIGLGAGGNKVRKLEWTVGDALAGGADTLVTTGAAQSNHARLTAAAGARLGLRTVLVLAGQPGDSRSGNIAVDGLFGAQIRWSGNVDHEGLEQLAADVADQLRHEGSQPVVIPFGGSSATGVRGYAEAGRELLVQAPDVDTVVVAVGSGGTMAGLLSVLDASRVLGVHTGAVADPAKTVASLAGQAGISVDPSRLRIALDQVGGGYSILTEEVAAALDLAARTEGIVLDPIYTGRAMAALISAARDGEMRPGTKTIFVHTGGLPGLFGHPDAVAHATAGAGNF